MSRIEAERRRIYTASKSRKNERTLADTRLKMEIINVDPMSWNITKPLEDYKYSEDENVGTTLRGRV